MISEFEAARDIPINNENIPGSKPQEPYLISVELADELKSYKRIPLKFYATNHIFVEGLWPIIDVKRKLGSIPDGIFETLETSYVRNDRLWTVFEVIRINKAWYAGDTKKFKARDCEGEDDD